MTKEKTEKTENDHGAGQFPHEGGCLECRKLMQCNACAAPIYAGLNSKPGRSARCTNGRCSKCHREYCTLGSSGGFGHGYWQKGSRPKHLVRYPETRGNCRGSGYEPGGFAGDEHICPVCGKYVIIKRDGKLRVHREGI